MVHVVFQVYIKDYEEELPENAGKYFSFTFKQLKT